MDIKKKKKVIVLMISVILIIMTFIIFIFYRKNSTKYSDNSSNEVEQSEEENKLNSKLKTVSESERIKIYLGTYLKYIEKKDYNSAYNLLYPEFKQNYFPTLEEYEKYIKEQQFPDMLAIEYEQISLQGNYYVVTVNIGDLITRSKELEQEKTFIIKEDGYNNYYISLKK